MRLVADVKLLLGPDLISLHLNAANLSAKQLVIRKSVL